MQAFLAETGTVSRCEHNTLAVVLPDRDRNALAELTRLLSEHARASKFQTAVGALSASFSAGLVVVPEQAGSAEAAVDHALSALEHSKKQPAGGVVFFDADMAASRHAARERVRDHAVIRALDEGRMLLALQPVVHAKSRKLGFYEALLRLRLTDGRLISAAEFVGLAEELGMARLLDQRALELAVPVLLRRDAFALSVNISSLTIGDEAWLATLMALTGDQPEVRRRLIVEITETAMIHDIAAARDFLNRLRDLGCRVAIDDFGAGYTSLQQLRQLPADILKIDGALIGDLLGDAQAQAIVRAMIDMARALGLETVAEWVANEGEAEMVSSFGVTYLQGFAIAPPQTVDAMTQAGVI